MSLYIERASAHSFIEAVWQVTPRDAYWVPVDGCWDIIFAQSAHGIRVFLAGPMTKAMQVIPDNSTHLLGVRFKTGVHMPSILPYEIVDTEFDIAQNTSASFMLSGIRFTVPIYDSVEEFVDNLAYHQIITYDPLIRQILDSGVPADMSLRTAQRHYAKITGTSMQFMAQLRRIEAAQKLLKTNHPLAAVAYAAGFADHAHMTRSFKRFTGQTPTELLYL